MKILNKKVLIIIPLILFALLTLHLNSMITDSSDNLEGEEKDNLPLYLLGSFRNVIADLIWIRIDLYHHSWQWAGDYWADNQNLVMLYRLVTYMNPHFDRAYAQGGYHLSINLKKPEQGMKFLLEGLDKNPESFEINFELGYEYFFIYNNYPKTIEVLRKAVILTKDDKQKQICYKLLAHSYYKLEEYDESLLYWIKVKQLASDQPMVDAWLQEVKSKLE